jgi:hypothetical protein
MMVDVPTLTLAPRPVATSLDELLAGAVGREPFLTSDGKSGAAFERITLADGSACILKHVHVDGDWTMRFNGDVGCHPAQVWAAGLMDVLPERIDHGVVGVATGLGRDGLGAAILMRDLTDALVPPGDDVLPLDRHLAYIDDMARLSARTIGWRDHVGLVPLANRWTWFNHASLEVESARGWPDPVPRIAFDGWTRFEERAPSDVVGLIDSLRHDPSPLVAEAQGTPQSFVHGDWKLGNVGTAADGRTVLIDWTYPGEAPCTYELAWYLALNRARMPQSKEDAVDRFRSSLTGEGIDTDGWFDRQLALSLLAALVVFGWEKALGPDDELAWWCERAREGAARL